MLATTPILVSHHYTMTLDSMSLLQPFMDLIEDPFLKERVEETARLYFTGTSVTVNLIPSIIIGLLLLIGLLKLLGLPILASFGLDGIGGSGDGSYGAPSGFSKEYNYLCLNYKIYLCRRIWNSLIWIWASLRQRRLLWSDSCWSSRTDQPTGCQQWSSEQPGLLWLWSCF